MYGQHVRSPQSQSNLAPPSQGRANELWACRAFTVPVLSELRRKCRLQLCAARVVDVVDLVGISIEVIEFIEIDILEPPAIGTITGGVKRRS